MSAPVPALVTLHLWRVRPRAAGRALLHMGTDRARVRRTPGVRFAKLLGTGDGRTFTPRDADPTRWGLLATWARAEDAEAFEASPVARGWAAMAQETWRADLVPVAARGRWSGREPFGDPVPARTTGPVAALTRARLVARRSARFWAAVPPVSADLHAGDGLLAAVGIGEAPVGLQGTFSVWRDAQALRAFAHRGAAHREVVARTASEGWYAEELFARFAVARTSGTLDGVDPLAGSEECRQRQERRVSRVVEWDREQLRAGTEEVLDVYAEAMDVPRQLAGSRRSILSAHLDREGLRCVASRDGDGRLVGIAYGYVGEHGQWWHDRVQVALVDALGAAEAADWLRGSFEVCELHVRPAQQGTGLGRELLDTLLAGTAAVTALLTTPDSETRARGFYRAAGWVDLVRELHFPGDPRAFAVLGLRLPGTRDARGAADVGASR